jgi:3-methyladenine DNA glycosylase AlkD
MRDLATAVRRGLAARADPDAAPGMQRYMKSDMPFHGVAKPGREDLVRELVTTRPVPSPVEFAAAVRDLWDRAAYREERYVALTLCGHRRWAPPQDAAWVRLYRQWIVEGAWWDFTDEIASKRIGALLRADPVALTPVLREWAVDDDRWLRRTSVIAQLGSGGGTDLQLLRHAIEANLADPDFFLRKGIGWALRQHARVDPNWVREFVASHPDLSPLSRKEALKHLR